MSLNRRPRAITIDDVAEKAGVSAKTVSRVLNNEPNVRAAKRKIVMEASQALGYRPNPAARSLAGAKSFLLAHLHDNPVPEYVASANEGIYAACRAYGYFLLPQRVELDAADGLARLDAFLLTARPDAVILTPPLCDDVRVTDTLTRAGIPHASLSAAQNTTAEHVLRHDEHRAARELVEYLLHLGHTDIAMITGPEGHKAASTRYDGYVDALRGSGLEVASPLVEHGDYTMRSGLEAAQRLLVKTRKPTAIFAANDDMAVGALTAALALGLRIPEDISIAGYDDTRLASAVWPPLTTIRQPVSEMARRAAERLIQPDDSQPREEILDFELVVRASTGPVTREQI
jgi:LacI family transcriptional regulator